MTNLLFLNGISAVFGILLIAPLNAFASTLVHVPTGRILTGLTDPQLRHACIEDGLILGMGSVALDGNNSAAAINKYGNITDHCLTTPTPEYGFKVK